MDKKKRKTPQDSCSCFEFKDTLKFACFPEINVYTSLQGYIDSMETPFICKKLSIFWNILNENGLHIC